MNTICTQIRYSLYGGIDSMYATEHPPPTKDTQTHRTNDNGNESNRQSTACKNVLNTTCMVNDRIIIDRLEWTELNGTTKFDTALLCTVGVVYATTTKRYYPCIEMYPWDVYIHKGWISIISCQFAMLWLEFVFCFRSVTIDDPVYYNNRGAISISL